VMAVKQGSAMTVQRIMSGTTKKMKTGLRIREKNPLPVLNPSVAAITAVDLL